MRSQRFAALVAAAALAAALAACNKAPDAASLTCADLDKVTDPGQQAALREKCGLGGPGFKASPKKGY